MSGGGDTMSGQRRQIARLQREVDLLQRQLAAVRQVSAEPARHDPVIRRLLARHAGAVGATVDELCSRLAGRNRLARVRGAFAREAQAAGFSLAVIGRVLGGRDHATVAYLIARASQHVSGVVAA